MNMQSYYSWVCFIDAQKGSWFGPISAEEIEQYEKGFAIDRNIKSFTEFTYFDSKPEGALTCNFSKKVTLEQLCPVSITYEQSVALAKAPVVSGDGRGALVGTARLLVYNATDVPFQISLLEHDNNQKKLVNPGCPNRAEWRLINDGYGTYVIKFWDASGTRLVFRHEYYSNVPYDRHFTIHENATGYYLKVEEYC
jgi:hypothetical protein